MPKMMDSSYPNAIRLAGISRVLLREKPFNIKNWIYCFEVFHRKQSEAYVKTRLPVLLTSGLTLSGCHETNGNPPIMQSSLNKQRDGELGLVSISANSRDKNTINGFNFF